MSAPPVRLGPEHAPNEHVLASLPPDARQWVLDRIGAGLTKAEASRRAGISAYWLLLIEQGKGKPSAALANRLRAIYGGPR